MRVALGSVALLLLLAAFWSALPAGAQAANSDMGVRSMGVLGVPRVGGQLDVTVVVVNAGPGPAASFNVYFGLDDAVHPLNGTNATSSFSYPTDAAAFSVEDTGGACAQQVSPAPLAVGCSLRVNRTWLPNATQQGVHDVVVQVSVPAPGADPNPSNDTARQGVFVELHDLRLGLDARDDHGKTVQQGDAAAYRANLTNRGNVAERVALGVRGDPWSSGGSSVPGNIVLAPNATVPVLGLLRSPTDSGSPLQSGANLTARNFSTELGNASLALPLTTADAALNPTYGFVLDPPAGEQLVDPGGQADLVLRVRGTGNAEDAVKVRISGSAPGWTFTLPAPFAVVPGTAGQSGDLLVRAAADAAVPAGSAVNVTVSATSVNRQELQASLAVTFRASAPDLALGSVGFDRAAVYAGDAVNVRVEVRNAGNLPLTKPARVALTAVRGADELPVDDALVSGIPPGDARIVVLRWDTTGFSGAYDLRLRLDPQNDVAELHEDNNDRTFPAVVRTPALAVDAPLPREARPGQHVDFPPGDTFRVRNLGNAAEDVRVDIASAQGWLRDARTVTLGPGEERSLAFGLDVPARPGTVDEAVTATATLLNRTATVATNATHVAINDTDPPVLVELAAPSFVELGQPAPFRARLADAVGVRSAVLTLREPDGTLHAAPLAPGEGDAWSADVVLAQAGTVSYWLTAVDATPLNNTLDTRATPGAVLVGVRAAPLVELVDPHDGASVRPGALLRLRITDIHGVGSVSVRDGARAFELAEPYAIGTGGWEEGVHTVDVTARNRYGNAATLEFNVTIDGTPPVARDARLDPARPQPGQAFTVSASASGDAVRASLQVRQQGRLVQEVPADLGNQVATATLTLPAGSYQLTMRVEDAAGNAAGADVAATVGGGGVPGFGPLLLLLAAGLACALAARRR